MSEFLNRFLSRAGVASRRHAVELIRDGRVRVNGTVVTLPQTLVEPDDRVECGGQIVTATQERFYLALHKPAGYTSSHSDPHAEKLAVDLIRLPGNPKLGFSGRLDKLSEGLMIFSNDGGFLNRLTHPRYGICKRYIVTPSRPLRPAELTRLRGGIESEGERLRPERLTPLADGTLEFVLAEGKKHEIRRLLASCGVKTVRLIRVAIGAVELGDLPCGHWRALTPEEIESLGGPEKTV